jgi:hypothetical protein
VTLGCSSISILGGGVSCIFSHRFPLVRVDVPAYLIVTTFLHILAGQTGLFAIQGYRQFDIVGEYCGEVTAPGEGGEYATYLEEKRDFESLGLDAQHCGNESRAIVSK